jgi:hypothetical protein
MFLPKVILRNGLRMKANPQLAGAILNFLLYERTSSYTTRQTVDKRNHQTTAAATARETHAVDIADLGKCFIAQRRTLPRGAGRRDNGSVSRGSRSHDAKGSEILRYFC